MTATFTLAHLSDVHLSPVTGFSPRHWNAKRALGFLNWQHKRRHVHLREVADRLVADLKAHAPDHIAVTGDLINIGLPHEYEAAARWLSSVGQPSRVSLVPGNHDIYCALRRDPGIGRWRTYMTGEPAATDQTPRHGVRFPYLRRLGPVVLVGLCSAIETAPGAAIGMVGSAQIASLQRLLGEVADQTLYRIVLIHHPPLPGMTRPRHELTDAAALAEALAETSADLVLHGHTHLPTHRTIDRAGRPPIDVVGVASASAGAAKGHEPLAQYNLIRIGWSTTGSTSAWQVEVERRGLVDRAGAVVEISRTRLR